jgi:hypothetical protein
MNMLQLLWKLKVAHEDIQPKYHQMTKNRADWGATLIIGQG